MDLGWRCQGAPVPHPEGREFSIALLLFRADVRAPPPPCMQYDQGGPSGSANGASVTAAAASSSTASKGSSGLDGIFADLGSRFTSSSPAPAPAAPGGAGSSMAGGGTTRLGLGGGATGASSAAPPPSSGGTKLVFGKKEDLVPTKETDSLLGLWGRS